MGSPDGEIGRDVDEKQRQVTIKAPFYLGLLEVTRAQWKRVMKTEPEEGDELRPVAMVSYLEAVGFCDALSRLEAGNTYRLPTEEEWEYACRAGSSFAFAGNGNVGEMGWTLEVIDIFLSTNSADNLASRGGLKLPNAWGLFDVHGNLKEWTSALVLTNRSKPDPLKVIQEVFDDPKPHRVVRGGGLFQEPVRCRSAFRDWELEDTVSTDVGFRVVLVTDQPTS